MSCKTITYSPKIVFHKYFRIYELIFRNYLTFVNFMCISLWILLIWGNKKFLSKNKLMTSVMSWKIITSSV